MPKVRAKFRCESVEHQEYGRRAKLSAVYSEKGENADFAQATPWGELNIQIDKDVPAVDFFKPGKSYYLDMTEAPE